VRTTQKQSDGLQKNNIVRQLQGAMNPLLPMRWSILPLPFPHVEIIVQLQPCEHVLPHRIATAN
jgi:hypothetical protein